MPVATLQSGNIYPVHTDHLGAPRVITDASGGIVWQWVSDPFGTTIANSDPDGDGQHFVYSLRFPGQYYDAETGRHYNYFRDYDPNTGRYIQSDPIGLEGGLNTYLYSNANPINYFDLFGLMSNYMACIVDCNMIFDWDTQDRLDTLIGYHTDCSFKSRQAVGNCAVAAIGTDIGLTYYNRGKLQKCLMQCKDYHESDCNE
ncbi:RHS repeat domain-containing protein [Candidatus Reidiella endopervernicosa]|uniref:RHS domain-containing protein n=1 Tax=Candidatus Reidiella endopervernicosa TaxID=2738883 RepID=A0A6N0HZS8_9GAMM|nr:RHS repeat-associated core domain-containing protein [Candidatus Reidiella endopervernicosa]QKQ27823.1 RHS domain-containing protein [Candidatus Reidiella endopervernicosa]